MNCGRHNQRSSPFVLIQPEEICSYLLEVLVRQDKDWQLRVCCDLALPVQEVVEEVAMPDCSKNNTTGTCLLFVQNVTHKQ